VDRGALLLTLLCGACAVTTSTCPTGTKLVGAQKPEGRARWCEVTDGSSTGLPLQSRAFEGKLALVQPTGMPGGIEGPFTSWYPDGRLAFHGSYKNFGARSVPDGLWTFWYPSGQRRLMGRYRRGQPDGCFAVWDESGQRKTGTVEGDELRVETCTPPSDDEVVALERGGTSMSPRTTFADVHVEAMGGPNRIGAANPDQVAQDPGMVVAFSAAARKHLGRLRVGPVVGVRPANESGYMALAVGATAAWRLPQYHPRLDTEFSLEMGAEWINVSTAQRRMQPGVGSVSFWTALPAAQLTFAISLSPNLEALVGARVDGLPARDVDVGVVYCNNGCSPPIAETWSIGGVSAGVALGLRLLAY